MKVNRFSIGWFVLAARGDLGDCWKMFSKSRFNMYKRLTAFVETNVLPVYHYFKSPLKENEDFLHVPLNHTRSEQKLVINVVIS